MTEQQQYQQQPARPPLRRSKDDRVIAGVCGGLARTLGIDPIIVRVLVAAFSLAGGAGVFAYIIAWILIPDDGGESVVDMRRTGTSKGGKFFIAILLAALGLAVVSSLTPGSDSAFGFFLFVLIAVVVWQAFGSDWFTSSHTTPPGSGTATGDTPNVTVDRTADGQTVTVHTPDGRTIVATKQRSILGRLIVNLIVLVTGVMIALNWMAVTDIPGETMFAVAIGLTGLGLVVSAFVGRARGLIALGLVLGMLAWPTTLHVDASAGTQTWRPTSVSAADAGFDLGMGTATLDLATLGVLMHSGEEVTVKAHVGVGELIVLLPSNLGVHGTVHSRVGIGDIRDDRYAQVDGFNREQTTTYGTDGDGPVINIDASVGVGQVTIQYQEDSVMA